MEEVNKNTGLDGTNNKAFISDVNDNIKPIKCLICYNEDQNIITNIINDEETNAWFCLKCGGLIGWIK